MPMPHGRMLLISVYARAITVGSQAFWLVHIHLIHTELTLVFPRLPAHPPLASVVPLLPISHFSPHSL